MKYKNLLASNGFNRVINEYTREEVVNNELVRSCIDHICYKGSCKKLNGIIIQTKISDHYVVGLTLLEKPADDKNISDKNPKVTYLNAKIINNCKQTYDWTTVLNEPNPNLGYNILKTGVNKIYEKATICRDNTGRKEDCGWMNDDLYKLLHDRDILFRKWKNTQSNIKYKSQYQSMRNKCVAEIRKAKRNYWNMKLSESKNFKTLWKT